MAPRCYVLGTVWERRIPFAGFSERPVMLWWPEPVGYDELRDRVIDGGVQLQTPTVIATNGPVYRMPILESLDVLAPVGRQTQFGVVTVDGLRVGDHRRVCVPEKCSIDPLWRPFDIVRTC